MTLKSSLTTEQLLETYNRLVELEAETRKINRDIVDYQYESSNGVKSIYEMMNELERVFGIIMRDKFNETKGAYLFAEVPEPKEG